MIYLELDECVCEQGWSKLDCDAKTSCVKRSHCFNNGICVVNDNEFVCLCAYGFAGPRCAQKLAQITLTSTLLPNLLARPDIHLNNTLKNFTSKFSSFNFENLGKHDSGLHMSLTHIEVMVIFFLTFLDLFCLINFEITFLDSCMCCTSCTDSSLCL